MKREDLDNLIDDLEFAILGRRTSNPDDDHIRVKIADLEALIAVASRREKVTGKTIDVERRWMRRIVKRIFDERMSAAKAAGIVNAKNFVLEEMADSYGIPANTINTWIWPRGRFLLRR